MKKLLLPMMALVLLMTGCNTVSRLDKRISAHPEWFNDLSEEHREMVRQGRIQEGMSHEAVILAWGPPDRVQVGSTEGKKMETWIYESWEPVYSSGVSIGVGYGGYPYGYGGYGWYPGYTRDVDYRKYADARVDFEGGKVNAWRTDQR